MGYVYFGESAGARILRYGVGNTQIGDPYQLEVRTWDVWPSGQGGRCVFRTITGVLRHTAGYDIQVTPVVDGVAQAPQRFNGGPPVAGLLEAIVSFSAAVFAPGARLDAIVQSVTLAAGELELIDLQATFAAVRQSQ